MHNQLWKLFNSLAHVEQYLRNSTSSRADWIWVTPTYVFVCVLGPSSQCSQDYHCQLNHSLWGCIIYLVHLWMQSIQQWWIKTLQWVWQHVDVVDVAFLDSWHVEVIFVCGCDHNSHRNHSFEKIEKSFWSQSWPISYKVIECF